MEWRFINSGPADSYTNMAIDEAIMTAHQKGLVPPTLRLYSWNPAGVSIGYFQKIDKAVNLEACSHLGIDVVRRLTGGRGVLHESEITYSVVVSENYPEMPGSIVESYKFICRGLIEGLRLAGVEVAMESGKNRRQSLGSSACFDSPSMYEIIHEGKKLVGSSQVRKNGVILQHGSILIDFDVKKQMQVLNKNRSIDDKLESILKNKVTSLKNLIGDSIDTEKITQMIFDGYSSTFGIEGKFTEILPEEELCYSNLIDKYKSEDWLNLK